MIDRITVYNLIDGEREYQDARWKESISPFGVRQHSATEWLVYMQDYLTEAMHTASRETDSHCNPRIMASIRKITAMGVAAMEQLGAPRREA